MFKKLGTTLPNCPVSCLPLHVLNQTNKTIMVVPGTIWLTFGLFLSWPLPASARAPYCLPADDCFPSTDVLQAFNASIDGRLLQTQPYGAACYRETYDKATCQRLARNKALAQWRIEQPGKRLFRLGASEADDYNSSSAIPQHGTGCTRKRLCDP